jgi:hypothetical protein
MKIHRVRVICEYNYKISSRSLVPLLLHPVEPRPFVVIKAATGIRGKATPIKFDNTLGISISLCNIARRSASLPTPAIENNFLVFHGLLKPMLCLERIGMQVQRIREHGER